MFEIFAAAKARKPAPSVSEKPASWEKYVFMGVFAATVGSVAALVYEPEIKNFGGQIKSAFTRLNPL